MTRAAGLISTHPATTARETSPDGIVHCRDELLALIDADALEEGGAQAGTNVEAYADGMLGFVYAESVYTLPDGTAFPVRGLAIACKEDGRWRYLYGLNAIPVPDELLVAGSPLAVPSHQ